MKAREFWIDHNTVDAWVGKAQSKQNYNFMGGIHVIEYSAYEQLKKDAQALVRTLEIIAKGYTFNGIELSVYDNKFSAQQALKTFNEKYGAKL